MWAWPFFPPVRGIPGLPGESSSSRSLSAAMAAPSGTCILLAGGGGPSMVGEASGVETGGAAPKGLVSCGPGGP